MFSSTLAGSVVNNRGNAVNQSNIQLKPVAASAGLLSNIFTVAPTALPVDAATAAALAADTQQYLRNNGSVAAGPFAQNSVRAYNMVGNAGGILPVSPLSASVNAGVYGNGIQYAAYPRLSDAGLLLPPYAAAMYYGSNLGPWCNGGCSRF
jgi:hypothetical protein